MSSGNSTIKDDEHNPLTHQTNVWIHPENDISLVQLNEGPMLKSIRLLETACRRIGQQFGWFSSLRISACPFHQLPISFFIDIDYLRNRDGHLHEGFKEVCQLLKQSGNNIYGITSLPIASTTVDDINIFTSFYFNDRDGELGKAKIITKIIVQSSETPQIKLFFGGHLLLKLLESEYNDSMNLNLAIEFMDSRKYANDSAQSNQRQVWLLNDYSMFEFIVYYIIINQTINKESNNFQFRILEAYPNDDINEGPILQSFRLLTKAISETSSKLNYLQIEKMHKISKEINGFIYVLIDLDWAIDTNGYLPSEVQEILSFYIFMENSVYAVTSKPLSELQLTDELHTFTQIFYHPSGCESVKAYSFLNIIKNNIPSRNRHILSFGGPILTSSLQLYCSNTIDLVVDISDNNNLVTMNDKNTRLPFNLDSAWHLENYSIMEYILYYVAINRIILEFIDDQKTTELWKTR